MLFPEKMVKIRVYSTLSLKDSLIDFLHKEGLLHLETANLPLKRFSGFEWYEELSKVAVKVRGLAKLLSINPKKSEIRNPEELIKEANHILENLEGVEELARKINDLEERREILLRDYLTYKKYSRFYKGAIPESAHLYAITGKEEVVKGVMKSLEGKEEVLSMEKKSLDNENSLLLVASSSPLSLNGEEVKVFEYPREGLDYRIRNVKMQLSEMESEISSLKEKLEVLKEKYGEKISLLLWQLNVYSDRASASENFKSSDYFFVIEGWLPLKELSSFSKKLSRKFDNSVFLEKIKTHDVPPTKLNNEREIKSFEQVVESISLPKGNQIDPTKIFALFIPLLYGMIIGDVIYSLFAMLFAFVLYKKFPKSKMAKMASEVWIFSSFAGIIWGIIFDEWMGVSHYYWFSTLAEFGINVIDSPLYYGFSRSHYIPLLMVASIIIGVAHLIIGFLLGAYSEMRHSKKHAIGKIGFAMFLFSVALIIPAYAGYVQMNIQILSALLLLSLILVFYGEGVIGLMELPTAIGNTISYIRLAAVGLVGVILAELINEFFTPSPAAGLLNLFLFALLISLNFFNAVIAMFEGIIQGGRLNLVEFGTKVYKGGGKKYKPFRLL